MFPVMATACVDLPQARVHLRSERLEVTGPDPASGDTRLLRAIPLLGLDRLLLHERAQITTQALAALLKQGGAVAILSGGGRLVGSCLPGPQPDGAARLRQYERTRDAGFASLVACRLVTAKVSNQRRLLQRLASNRGQSLITELLPFHLPSPATQAAATLDQWRGWEGYLTALYFRLWGRFFPAEFPFERRSTRPPLNPVNAVLSFGVTLLYHEIVGRLHAHGLDPALGLLHTTAPSRWSLALDLVEPFRPAFAEALTVHCFAKRILAHPHFEPRANGIYLNAEGRHRYLDQFETRMEREFLSEHLGHRTTLRRVLDWTATNFKAALEEPPLFRPFLLN